jgi:hypothetical protein
MKLVTNKFKSGGLHEKHVLASWNLGNHLSICRTISAFAATVSAFAETVPANALGETILI